MANAIIWRFDFRSLIQKEKKSLEKVSKYQAYITFMIHVNLLKHNLPSNKLVCCLKHFLWPLQKNTTSKRADFAI